MSKRFEAAVLSLRPDFAIKDKYFYYMPVGHILCGFVYEKARGRAYIWRFALPLYDHHEFLSLTFAERLPRPEGIMPGFSSDLRAAEEFVRRIEPYESETRTWQEPQTFLRLFEDPHTLANPWVRRCIAWTYILIGKPAEARAHMHVLLNSEEPQDDPHFLQDVRQILDTLESSLDEAQKSLLGWEVATKLQFQIRDGAIDGQTNKVKPS
jgi:hypothetical protein